MRVRVTQILVRLEVFLVTQLSVGAFCFLNNMASTMSEIKSTIIQANSGDVILSFETPMSPIIKQFAQMSFKSREERASAMAHAMQTASMHNQAPVLAALSAFSVQAESYWITNQIFVKGTTPAMIQSLAEFTQIRSITSEQKHPLFPLFNTTTGNPPNGTLWNIQQIKADLLWKEGIKGKGVIVASIDTGVRGTHNAIKNNYVGNENHGWYDPSMKTREPNDYNGHGTHTVGTMVGNNGIGAAPKAKWMACKGCAMATCAQHDLLACGQFVLCPTEPKSKKLNCSHIPHIVNNSWGGPGGSPVYDDMINAWKAVGIIPFFAIGNSGSKCETAGSPGDNDDVIAIGSTDINDRLSKFSSRGPKMITVEEHKQGPFGQTIKSEKKQASQIIKPNVCAPGQDINSASFLTDNSYRVHSGTSMASPLAAGAGALLLSKNPNLTLDEMRYLLYSTAEQHLQPTRTPQCGPIPETEFPNHMYGHGRINVYKAYKKLLQMMKQSDKEHE